MALARSRAPSQSPRLALICQRTSSTAGCACASAVTCSNSAAASPKACSWHQPLAASTRRWSSRRSCFTRPCCHTGKPKQAPPALLDTLLHNSPLFRRLHAEQVINFPVRHDAAVRDMQLSPFGILGKIHEPCPRQNARQQATNQLFVFEDQDLRRDHNSSFAATQPGRTSPL
jgi:hypothetical protein